MLMAIKKNKRILSDYPTENLHRTYSDFHKIDKSEVYFASAKETL